MVLHKGDADFTAAGVARWHGAAPDTHAVMAMVHFGGIGPWLEPVTDGDYQAAARPNSNSGAHAQRPLAGANESAPRSTATSYVGESSTFAAGEMQVARSRLVAGGCTNWHVHAAGQSILAEEGPVYVQRRNRPVKILRTGEGDFTPPGVAYRHGAAPARHATKVFVGFAAPTERIEPVSGVAYVDGTGSRPH